MYKRIFILCFLITNILFADYSTITIGNGASININKSNEMKAYITHFGSESGTINVLSGGSLHSWGPEAVINFNISGDGDISLPVQISTFSATLKNGIVVLKWSTESEINNSGFNIYRRSNINEYLQINRLLIKGAGSSSEKNNYLFKDKNINSGKIYTYLIEDVGLDGKRTKHQTLSVKIKVPEFISNHPVSFALHQACPNPFNPTTTIQYSILKEVNVKLIIYDLSGTEIETLVNRKESSGNYKVNWNASKYASGVYFYKIEAGEFTDFKKCMLLK